ncbi:hypothetical protein M409DRAFT_22350 [Zasmidium cellare ATCC 36951]|uniref:Coenzyme Q-binding protein COQ10 START domain-containing protein n=1 Tax=Zasmidium cellare ATCC 36951 TaxID=1080233 RepID=A0A6A6CJZ1_ZASCE|nr:uncharacterized protein M409DRAFT_22350 [Zasmidium cellare ATCC 36951]KAF2167544.1 hypothetical protein M409DRAFT_22350 [Zasmidium cellare ATCC 36951]
MASSTVVHSPTLYVPNVPGTSNVRFAENRIISNAKHTAVFDYVTTWANLPKWLPVSEVAKVWKGNEDAPAEMGDVLYEEIKDKTRSPKVYTVVVLILGLLWVVSGIDEGETVVKRTVTFLTAPPDDGRTFFSRVFQDVRQYGPDLDSTRLSVMQPAAIQPGLKRLKALVEERWGT